MTIPESINQLFTKAKETDEFEFICTLINFKGMGTIQNTSNLFEWFQSIDYYQKLINQAENNHQRTRIAILLYSTFFESSDLYNIIGSLCRITLGLRSSSYLFFKHDSADRWYGTGEKIGLINDLLIDSGFNEIQIFFEQIHHKELRNTFFHSSYSLEDDEYILHDSEPIFINRVGHSSLSISNFINPRINAVLEFYNSFKDNYINHSNSYKTEKIVRGRFPELMDIKIYGSENGLMGFVAGGSSILLKDNFWEAWNIRLNTPSELDRHISDELKRFLTKEKIHSNDGLLQHLYDVIKKRNIKTEKTILAKVYERFANIFMKKASSDEDDFKKPSLYKIALTYFDKTYELDPTIKLDQRYALAMYLVGGNVKDDDLKKKSLTTIIKCLDLNNTQEDILKNTLHIICDLRDNGVQISTELKLFKIFLDSISVKEYEELIKIIHNKIGK
jgi:hypothetical protein